MAKGTDIRRRKRSFSLLNFSTVIFLATGILYLSSALFLRSYNNYLSTRKQEISQEIAMLELQNDSIEVEIARLTSSDRVDYIAANNGMSRDSANVVTIQTSPENGD